MAVTFAMMMIFAVTGKGERKMKWRKRKNWSKYVCPVCSFEFDKRHEDCPNCGAKMDLED